MNKITSIVAILVVVFSFSACKSDTIYEQKVEVDKPLTYTDTLSFDYAIADTAKNYNVYIAVDHKDDFAFQNIYFNFIMTFPDGTTVPKPISLDLEQNGAWAGDCSMGSCHTALQLFEKIKFSLPGKYKLKMVQHSRQPSLDGIDGIGVSIEVAK